MMAELDYDELQRLADAATPGPWFQGRGNQRFEKPREVYSKREPEEEDSHDIATFVWSDEDAEFIVASRSAIPALLDRVRELEAERDAALSTIAKVEALHQETACEVDCCGAQPMCSECGVQGIWPCETIRALGSVVWALEEAPEVES